MENLSQARDTDGCNSSGSEKNMKIQCTVVWFITIKTPILCGDLYRYIYRTVTKMTAHWTAAKTIKMSIFWLMINLGKLLMDIISQHTRCALYNFNVWDTCTRLTRSIVFQVISFVPRYILFNIFCLSYF